MKKYTLNAIGAVSLALAITTLAPGQDTESRVAFKDLPAAVQKTVNEQRKAAVLRGLAKEIEGGQTFYEAEMRVNGHNRDVLMDPSGKIVAIEEQVTLQSVPAPVSEAFLKGAGKGRVVLVESITKENVIVAYEAHVRTAGKLSEIKVDPNGRPAQ